MREGKFHEACRRRIARPRRRPSRNIWAADYRVLASYGHVRDLPPKDGSVDPDDDFAMEWEVYADKAKQLKAITDEAKKADTPDPRHRPRSRGRGDQLARAGGARQKKALPASVRARHLQRHHQAAVTEAMTQPRELDEDLIDAYRARRALDYLVGFTLSPMLWRKLPGAKSAGRVQSVALRLIVDREREIELFKPQEYWQVIATFEEDGPQFTARLVQLDGEKLDRLSHRRARARPMPPRPRSRPAASPSRRSRPSRFAKQPAAAVHHLDAAAGGRAQARLLGQPHDAGRPDALRGRRDHLHADRRRRRWRRRRSAPRARRSRTAMTAATCPKSRATTRPRPRTRRKRTRRSVRPISAEIARGVRRRCAALRAGL